MRVLVANRSGQRQPYQGFSEPGIGDPAAGIPAEIYASGRLLEMLPKCDYVVSIIPLTPETHHLFNAAAFAQMKNSAYFFNLGRGPLCTNRSWLRLYKDKLPGRDWMCLRKNHCRRESVMADGPGRLIISPHVSGFTPTTTGRLICLPEICGATWPANLYSMWSKERLLIKGVSLTWATPDPLYRDWSTVIQAGAEAMADWYLKKRHIKLDGAALAETFLAERINARSRC
jgi:hypothetical protein